MITNEREYRITRAQVRELERALATSEHPTLPEGVHPLLADAAREGLRGQIDELKAQLEEFDQLRAGRKTQWTIDTLGRVPDVIIQARIACDMTQRQFADQVGIKEQQVQRYESTRYHGVSLERIEQAAAAAGLQFQVFCWTSKLQPQFDEGASLLVNASGQWASNVGMPSAFVASRSHSVQGNLLLSSTGVGKSWQGVLLPYLEDITQVDAVAKIGWDRSGINSNLVARESA